jgi:hypothetical protein
LLVHLARVDPDAAFDVAQQLSGFLFGCAPGFLGEFAKESPNQAAAFAERINRGEMRDAAVERVARSWLLDDPGAALEWAQRQMGARSYRTLLESSLKDLSQRMPEEVAPALDDLPAGRQRVDWIQKTARAWAQRDFESCISWARTIDSNVDRDAALRTVAESRLNHNVNEAIDLAHEISSPTQQRAIIFQAVTRWVHENRPAAEAFVASLVD